MSARNQVILIYNIMENFSEVRVRRQRGSVQGPQGLIGQRNYFYPSLLYL